MIESKIEHRKSLTSHLEMMNQMLEVNQKRITETIEGRAK
jgi:hypothetical protein